MSNITVLLVDDHTIVRQGLRALLLSEGDISIVAEAQTGREAVEFVARSDAEFVLGSAVPHDHELVLGYYSVHTSSQTLQKGEAHIQAIRRRLVQQGRL